MGPHVPNASLTLTGGLGPETPVKTTQRERYDSRLDELLLAKDVKSTRLNASLSLSVRVCISMALAFQNALDSAFWKRVN